MKSICLVLFLLVHMPVTAVELLVVGDRDRPVQFVVLPFTYQGEGFSPAISVEQHIIQALSSTGLFSMPFRYEAPVDPDNLLGWELAGIRYVLNGRLEAVNQSLLLRLTITDTLGLQPTISTVLLNPEQLQLSSQMFADQVYRSLFYATFTNDQESQYLNNENPTMTRYLNQLVMAFKMAWQNNSSAGTCTVDVQQMPGGMPFKSRLQQDCFEGGHMGEEIQALMDDLEVLPYEKYQDVFVKDLTVQFIGISR